jgi:hypothetical protein
MPLGLAPDAPERGFGLSGEAAKYFRFSRYGNEAFACLGVMIEVCSRRRLP